MLDVDARSLRGRICGYTKNDSKITTPYIVRSVYDGECDDDIHIRVTENGRELMFFGSSVKLDRSLISSASSDLRAEPVHESNVTVLSLPLPESIELPEETEVVIVPNAYDLRGNSRMLVDTVIKLRNSVGYNVVIGMFGIAEPSTLALLTYMGIDLFDDSLVNVFGKSGIRLIPEGEVVSDGDVSDSNRDELSRECSKIKDFIRSGRLRELVDQRSVATPSSVATLRIFDRVGYEYQEESVDTAAGRFCCNTVQALRRPDVLRYRNMILERYEKPAHKKVLVLLPCSAKKPYHISKTHKRFSSAIHVSTFDTVVHEVIVTSPLGAVPRELDAMYPANAYDIPVTGEWKCQEKEFIRELIGHIISQGYDTVISHLGEDTELVRGLCEMKETVVGDSTSPASLQNLETALREATKGMEVGDYKEDRIETVRSMLKFQFGKEVADKIMDENTYVIGKFPFWKIMRDKVQIAMMSEGRGVFSFTAEGSEVLAELGCNIVEMVDFELKGNLFAVGVTSADSGIRIGDEAVVMCNGEVRGVGVAMMSGKEMCDLKRGIAVKIRHKAKR